MSVVLNRPVKSARKAKGCGHLRRAEILEAAERIFVAEGYEGATIRKIADEVGVSSTALYMHFRDKDQILLEICVQVIEKLLSFNSEISARPLDPVVRVRQMLEAYVRFGVEHPNAYLLVFCSPTPAHAVERLQATAEIGDRCFGRFAGVVSEIAAEGRLRAGDAKTAAEVLWAGCHGMVALMITKPDTDWADPERFMTVMIEGLLFGLVSD